MNKDKKFDCVNCAKEIYWGQFGLIETWRWLHKHSNNRDCMLTATPPEKK